MPGRHEIVDRTRKHNLSEINPPKRSQPAWIVEIQQKLACLTQLRLHLERRLLIEGKRTIVFG